MTNMQNSRPVNIATIDYSFNGLDFNRCFVAYEKVKEFEKAWFEGYKYKVISPSSKYILINLQEVVEVRFL